MRIITTYVGTLNGVSGMWCGFKPEGAKIEEERDVLFPDDGQLLEKDGETFSAVWLKDEDTRFNYKEVEINDESGVGDSEEHDS